MYLTYTVGVLFPAIIQRGGEKFCQGVEAETMISRGRVIVKGGAAVVK